MAIRRLPLGHLRHILRTRRAYGDDHDSVQGVLLQERRRDAIDATGNDDPVKRCVLLPAVIAVGVTGADGAILAIAARDETIVKRPPALRQGGDDLDRPDVG
jgi:hypothetical protein